MYCEFYQLTERPFNVTPDPKFLYLNARYREAIASLNYGITQRKGFITLIGEAGTGKTTLLKRLLEDLDTKTKSVFIFNTNVSFEEILEYIFAEFDLPVHNGKKLYMLQRLNTFLLEELRGGGNVALLIDEAQDLEFSVLEDLRLLSNLETAKEKILQIVLSGQPELGQKLSNPILRQLRQRIGINCRLLPLSRDEISEYIRFRLQAAGCPDLKLFSREAEDQIYHFSRGIPRLVNVVCDNALVIGYALGKKRIGADIITEAAADLLSVESAEEERREPIASASTPPPPVAIPSRWRPRLGVVGLVLAAVVVGLLSVGRSMLYRHVDEPSEAPPPVALEVIRPGSQPEGAGIESPPLAAEDGGIAMKPSERADLTADGADAAPEMAAKAPALLEEEEVVAGVEVAPADLRPVAPRDQPSGQAEEASVSVMRRSAADALPEPMLEEAVEQLPAEVQPPAQRGAVAKDADVVSPRPGAPDAAAAAPALAAAVPEPLSPDVDGDAADAEKMVAAPRPLDQPAAKPDPVPVRESEAAVPQLPPKAEEAPAEAANESTPRLDGVRFARMVVQSGDSVSGIALRKYGQASSTILDLLKLANPELRDIDLISVGQTIRLPELSEGFPILNDGSGYSLLVFSTPQLHRAAALQSALRTRGFNARVSGATLGTYKPMFRVVVPGFTSREEVVAVGQRLQKLFREDTRIAQLGE